MDNDLAYKEHPFMLHNDIPAFSCAKQDGQILRSQTWSLMDLLAVVMALALERGPSLDGCHDQLQALPSFVMMNGEGEEKLLMAQEVLSCTPVPPHLHPLHPREALAVEEDPLTSGALGYLYVVQQGHPLGEA